MLARRAVRRLGSGEAVKTYHLTAREVARLLGVHRNTVSRIPPSDLPYLRFGARGDRRYSVEDVRTYVDSRVVRQGPR